MPSIYITCTRLCPFPSETGITKALPACVAQLWVLQRSFQSPHLVLVSVTFNNAWPCRIMVRIAQPSTLRAGHKMPFPLLAAPSAANTPRQFFSAFALAQGFHKETKKQCPQNTEMHILSFSLLTRSVRILCQAFYLHFVTWEKIHCKYLSLTGILITLDFCNSPAIASQCAAPVPAPSLLETLLPLLTAEQMEQKNLLFPRVWSPKQPAWIRGH